MCRRKAKVIHYQWQNKMVMWREMQGAAAVAVPVQALKEHMVHFLLCQMTVLPLWKTSIRASASLQDQRLQRGGKRVSESADDVWEFWHGCRMEYSLYLFFANWIISTEFHSLSFVSCSNIRTCITKLCHDIYLARRKCVKLIAGYYRTLIKYDFVSVNRSKAEVGSFGHWLGQVLWKKRTITKILWWTLQRKKWVPW